MIEVDISFSVLPLMLTPRCRSMDLDEIKYRNFEPTFIPTACAEAESTEITEVKLWPNLTTESVREVDTYLLHGHLEQHIHVGCEYICLL